MNDTLTMLLLLAVPGLPLLLAFPRLRRWLPWTGVRYLALLPAVIIVAIPTTYSVEPSWLMFNAELGIGTGSRILLAMSVLLWAWVMFLLPANKDQPEGSYFTVFLMVTMAGNFGAILAMDLVTFYVFSVLLSYGFYGLLVSTNQNNQNKERRAGRVYLILLIIADIALFEVLLISVFTTEILVFADVHHAMAQSDYLALYLALVVFAFVVKAGIWPFHFWLVHAFRSVRPAVALLLVSVPVTVALTGLLRWLPLGEISAPQSGLLLQGLGVVTVLYALVFAIFDRLKKQPLTMLSVHSVLFATGVFSIGVGTVLADATLWQHYENGLYYFVSLLAFALALLLFTTGWLHNATAATTEHAEQSNRWFERWPAMLVSVLANIGFHTLPRWINGWQVKMQHLWLLICRREKQIGVYEVKLQGWSLAITLFVLLAIAITFVVAYVGLPVPV